MDSFLGPKQNKRYLLTQFYENPKYWTTTFTETKDF